MCDSGSQHRRKSSCLQATASSEPRALDAKFPWLSMTPLGSPVVPEVYKIVARVCGVTADNARCSSCFPNSVPAGDLVSPKRSTWLEPIRCEYCSYEKNLIEPGSSPAAEESLSACSGV